MRDRNIAAYSFVELPVKKGVNVEVISAAFHAIYFATLHKKEIGEKHYEQALRTLVHGVALQLFA